MNLIEFVNRYHGKKVDFDGHYGAQCVDLFRQYNRDVLGNERTESVGGAKDLVLQYEKLPLEKKYFMLLKNPYSAKEGDVAVWNSTFSNPYGHVAIVLKAENKRLVVFEQDGFRQDGAKITERNTSGILGYLREWPAMQDMEF